VIYPEDHHHPVEDSDVGETDVASVNGFYFRLRILHGFQNHLLLCLDHLGHQTHLGQVSPMGVLAHGLHLDHDPLGPSYPCPVRGQFFVEVMLVVILWLLLSAPHQSYLRPFF
jgi:hypothetical protein